MARFLIEAEHVPEDCIAALETILGYSSELLGRFDWGCNDGLHVGWAVLDAGDRAAVQRLLPLNMRGKARVVQLAKFTPEEVRSFHQG